MDEQRIEIHHEIVRKKGILIIISLLIEATWDDLFFFQVSSDLFWSSETFPNFLVLEGDDVIQTVAGVSGIPKRFFSGRNGSGICFFLGGWSWEDMKGFSLKKIFLYLRLWDVFLLMVNSERFLVSASVICFGMTLWRGFIFFLVWNRLRSRFGRFCFLRINQSMEFECNTNLKTCCLFVLQALNPPKIGLFPVEMMVDFFQVCLEHWHTRNRHLRIISSCMSSHCTSPLTSNKEHSQLAFPKKSV